MTKYRTCDCGVPLRVNEHRVCEDCAEDMRPADCRFDGPDDGWYEWNVDDE